MVFDGLKNFFNRIGGITIDSSRKVGGGVQAPVEKIGKIRPKRKTRDEKVKKPEKSESKFFFRRKKKKKPTSFKSEDESDKRILPKPVKSAPRRIKRMRMDKEEIEMFKELIDKKYETPIKAEEDDEEKEALRKASLEEILKKEAKPTVNPRVILLIAGVSFALIVAVVVALGFGIEIGLVFGVIILMMALFIVFMPKMQRGRKSSAAARELPYALRQMATELRAGVGLHDSMRSIALSGYGPLSEEFARALEEIRYGETTEKALISMSERIDSDGLKRAVYQITRTLTSGGDLAKTLAVIAEDTAYELRMKLKDYAQKLNSFTMIYMFIAILGPVIAMIMLIAASTVMGAILPPVLLLILYLFLFPAIVAFMAFMIKRLEPQI